MFSSSLPRTTAFCFACAASIATAGMGTPAPAWTAHAADTGSLTIPASGTTTRRFEARVPLADLDRIDTSVIRLHTTSTAEGPLIADYELLGTSDEVSVDVNGFEGETVFFTLEQTGAFIGCVPSGNDCVADWTAVFTTFFNSNGLTDVDFEIEVVAWGEIGSAPTIWVEGA